MVQHFFKNRPETVWLIDFIRPFIIMETVEFIPKSTLVLLLLHQTSYYILLTSLDLDCGCVVTGSWKKYVQLSSCWNERAHVVDCDAKTNMFLTDRIFRPNRYFVGRILSSLNIDCNSSKPIDMGFRQTDYC